MEEWASTLGRGQGPLELKAEDELLGLRGSSTPRRSNQGRASTRSTTDLKGMFVGQALL
jgi:hypothetical protein